MLFIQVGLPCPMAVEDSSLEALEVSAGSLLNAVDL